MSSNQTTEILALCGSLRAESSNLRALQAAKALTPPTARLSIFSDMSDLPAFNPDVEPQSHRVVSSWVEKVRHCDALLVSSPVYARGYPGALKNALDWLVSTDAFVAKPFALLNTSGRSLEIQDTLITVINTMSGVHVDSATTVLPLLGQHHTTAEILADRTLAGQIGNTLQALVDHCQAH